MLGLKVVLKFRLLCYLVCITCHVPKLYRDCRILGDEGQEARRSLSFRNLFANLCRSPDIRVGDMLDDVPDFYNIITCTVYTSLICSSRRSVFTRIKYSVKY